MRMIGCAACAPISHRLLLERLSSLHFWVMEKLWRQKKYCKNGRETGVRLKWVVEGALVIYVIFLDFRHQNSLIKCVGLHAPHSLRRVFAEYYSMRCPVMEEHCHRYGAYCTGD